MEKEVNDLYFCLDGIKEIIKDNLQPGIMWNGPTFYGDRNAGEFLSSLEEIITLLFKDYDHE